jgi:pyridoxal phosphate enzyme (YggS family)
MPVNTEAYSHIKSHLDQKNVTLVAVSKTKPVEDIQALYELGQRDFGENYVQELIGKAPQLPADIRWHFIGHLQSNKVRYIAPLVQLIHGVDSLKLLKEIGKQGQKIGRVIDCLLQVHIAQEETKFGLDASELATIMSAGEVPGARVVGLMGMASFTDDKEVVKKEFALLKELFDQYPSFTTLSMGMSSDYEIAMAEGSNMVRIGSLLFGERIKP